MINRLKSLITLIIIIPLLLPTQTLAAKPAALAKQEPVKELVCKEPIKLKGIPNRIESIAHMRAIIVWTKKVRKAIDEDHAAWHNAKDKNVNCKRAPGSQYYYCELVATPCVRKVVTPPEDEK